ncbi:hypothetical protein EPO66_06175, partial [bacterium]
MNLLAHPSKEVRDRAEEMLKKIKVPKREDSKAVVKDVKPLKPEDIYVVKKPALEQRSKINPVVRMRSNKKIEPFVSIELTFPQPKTDWSLGRYIKTIHGLLKQLNKNGVKDREAYLDKIYTLYVVGLCKMARQKLDAAERDPIEKLNQVFYRNQRAQVIIPRALEILDALNGASSSPISTEEIKERISLIENYPAGLTKEGKAAIDGIRRKVLGNKALPKDLHNTGIALESPAFNWFKPYLIKAEKEKLFPVFFEKGTPLSVSATTGCSNQCDYCLWDANAKVSYMPWPWVLETVSLFNEYRDWAVRTDRLSRFDLDMIRLGLWLNNDPLKDYFDPLYNKDYVDILANILEKTDQRVFFINTSGWQEGSVAEKAVLKISGLMQQYPQAVFFLRFHVNTESRRFRLLGYQEYTRQINAAYKLSRGIFGNNIVPGGGATIKFLYGSTGRHDLKLLSDITGSETFENGTYALFKPLRAGRAIRLPAQKTKPALEEYFKGERDVLFARDTIEYMSVRVKNSKGFVVNEILHKRNSSSPVDAREQLLELGKKYLPMLRGETSEPQDNDSGIFERYQYRGEKGFVRIFRDKLLLFTDGAKSRLFVGPEMIITKAEFTGLVIGPFLTSCTACIFRGRKGGVSMIARLHINQGKDQKNIVSGIKAMLELL